MRKNIKIGARVLSKDALHTLLPSNENIFKQIKSIRYMANHVYEEKENHCKNKNRNNNYKEFDEQFNNVFSILGGRGSGKTSALLTIKHRIMDKNKQDIVLPLIVPENMGENSDVLGWLFAQFEKEVTNLEKSLKQNYKNQEELNCLIKVNEYFEECRLKEKTFLSKTFDELIKHYKFINSDYREIMLKQYDTLNSYVKNSKNILAPEDELVIKFEEFIYEMLKVKKACNEIESIHYSSEQEKQPLIFVFFDDVDLSNHRCVEVLDVILRYLSNANIVTFVAGNYDTFSEIITINNLDKDKLLNINLDTAFFREKTCLEVRQELTQDILKKVIPPALRYHVPLFSNEAKAKFTYYKDENDDKEYPSMEDLIFEKLVKSNLEKINKTTYEKPYKLKDIDKFFLYYNKELISVYFDIFDNTPRGLMNVYYFLYNLEEIDIEENSGGYYKILKELLRVIVESFGELNEQKDEIYKIMDIKETIQFANYNYQYISKLFSLNKKNDTSVVFKIFLLTNFIEKLTELRYECIDESLGKNILNEILTENRISLYPNFSDVQFNLALYSLINKTVLNSKVSLSEENNYYIDTYFEQLDRLTYDTNKRYKYAELFLKICKEDSAWVRDKLKLIMSRSDNFEKLFLLNIDKTRLEFSSLFENRGINQSFEKEIKIILNNKNYDLGINPTNISISKLQNKLYDIHGDLNIICNNFDNKDNHYFLSDDEDVIENLGEIYYALNENNENRILKRNEKLNNIIQELIHRNSIDKKSYEYLNNYMKVNRSEGIRDYSEFEFLEEILDNILKGTIYEQYEPEMVREEQNVAVNTIIDYIKIKTQLNFEENKNDKNNKNNKLKITGEIRKDLDAYKNSQKSNYAFKQMIIKEMGK